MTVLLLVLHIAAAAAWFGTNIVQAVVTGPLLTNPATAAPWLQQTVAFGRKIYGPASVVLLITGPLLVIQRGHEFSDAFVGIGFAMVIIGGLLGSLVMAPAARRAIAAHESGKDADPMHRRMATFGILDTVLLVVTITAMVATW